MVPARHGPVVVARAEIDDIKAAENYVELITGDRTLLLRATLAVMLELRAAGLARRNSSA